MSTVCVRNCCRRLSRLASPGGAQRACYARPFHSSRSHQVVKPFLLADIGEGIRECQVIQWFVQPGARVEQFDKLCEIQSDKASVEITSRFDGVIKKLYYDADDMAIVGKPLVDIDIQSEISPEDEALTGGSANEADKLASDQPEKEPDHKEQSQERKATVQSNQEASRSSAAASGKHATLATPAVRHLTKEFNVDISDVPGSGKDGRVLKEDIHNFAASRSEVRSSPSADEPMRPVFQGKDRTISLSPIQTGMFKSMTRSLSIPHFLYSDSLDFSALSLLRRRLNSTPSNQVDGKLSNLSFIVKAVSLAMGQFPLLNASLDISTDPKKPQIILRAAHNIGVAVDSAHGLVVPVLRSVQDMAIQDIAAEIRRLSSLANEGKLTSADMSGGTFTVSNVGSIGGMTVAPVIVEGQVAILGVGRTRVVPAFDEAGNIKRREDGVLSWSADHRIVDGATVAKCAEAVRKFIEGPEDMLVRLR